MTPFSYARPTSLAAAADAVAGGKAQVMAGGQSLLLALKERKIRPSTIVAVRNLPELFGVNVTEAGTTIGAGTTYAVLAKTKLQGWQAEVPAVAGNLADRSVRNIGTVGGGVCQGDPRYDMPIVLSAADAAFTLTSTRGERVLRADDFFNAAGGTYLEADEILSNITLPPLPAWTQLVFEKFRYRTFEAAIGTAAIAVQLDDAGKILRSRIVIGAVTKAPFVTRQTMAAIEGKKLGELDPMLVGTQASHEALAPKNALTRQQQYQSELTISLVKRAVVRLHARIV